MKTFLKDNWLWMVIVLILSTNVPIVCYGRIYFPNFFIPIATTSFFDSYLTLLLHEAFWVFYPCMIIGLIAFVIILVVPKWEREFHLSIFRSWNPSGYQRIKDEEDRKKDKKHLMLNISEVKK